MTSRRMGAVAAAAAAALALTACGGGNAGAPDAAEFSAEYSGTVKAWGFENADDVGQARLDHAEQVLGESDTTVELDATAFDAQKFTTLAASGQVPDVVQMDRNFVATYAAQGLIQPLDACFAAHEVTPDDRWYEQVVDDVTWNDAVWAVPQFYQPPAILLNERVLGEAGVTDAEIDPSNPDALMSAIERMTVLEGSTPTRIGFDPQGVSKAALWMMSFGGGIIDDEGLPTLDRPENVEAVEFLQEIYDAQGGYANVKSFLDSFDVFGDGNSFVNDTIGAAVWDQWYPNVLTAYAGEIEIGAVPLMAQDGEPITAAAGQAFVIPTNAQNPSAACAWALELTSPEAWQAAGEARAETTASNPERQGINTGLFTGSPEVDQDLREQFADAAGFAGFDDVISTYYEVAAEGESYGASPAGQEIQSELQNAVTSALLGESSAQEALAQAQEAAMRAHEQVAGGQ
ncbi:ABC transporter substrate-binding protein [Agrococcus sp. HG114]|uniref:ABC transporter substrate-binding protein n=1 Tax=Agrococcus sp. HG114 TaxID=2969757 RepID=UPI00215AA2D5|nr:extracellular solute-binding protein [Agrococcus sp. HG114]MCR8671083.1 extracellular solute-binding protein [Agrococcus sp. HG114]